MTRGSPNARHRSRSTVMIWHRHHERAAFEEFIHRDHTGRVRFEGQRPTEAKRFRERVWPVFWRIRPVWRTTDAWDDRRSPVWAVDWDARWTRPSGSSSRGVGWSITRSSANGTGWTRRSRQPAARGRSLCLLHARMARNILTRLESNR